MGKGIRNRRDDKTSYHRYSRKEEPKEEDRRKETDTQGCKEFHDTILLAIIVPREIYKILRESSSTFYLLSLLIKDIGDIFNIQYMRLYLNLRKNSAQR